MVKDHRPPHPVAVAAARDLAAGRISRREFLTRATAMGLSLPAACALTGAPAPAQEAPAPGGASELRIQMEVRPLKDPRLWDWPQIANVCRGWLEYLVELEHDGSLKPMLLDGWEVSADATVYTLRLRDGVTWTNGDALTADHVAHNFRRWCESRVEGNSMASRMGGLVDPATGTAREGAIEVLDARTLRLTLPAPDVTLMAGVADYPAAIVHPTYDGGDPAAAALGTGPYLPVLHEVGQQAVLERNPDHPWWGEAVFGRPALDRIVFRDYGTDPASWLAALEAGEVDMLYESVGEFVGILDEAGFPRSEAVTANTIVIRPNQDAGIDGRRPYADVRVRRALALACDNAVILELGYAGQGTVAKNDHVCPIHPDHAELPPPPFDPAAARRLMEEAGYADFEHELVSIDDDWRKNTSDAVAAMLNDAGIPVSRRILPGAVFWEEWLDYPYSSTDWNHRPLGVQVLALAYRSGEAWNESGFSNARFDRLLARALGLADAAARREVMAELQQILRDEGVIVQPYWRTIFRHFRAGVIGAEVHPSYEIHLYKLGLDG